MVAQKQKRNPAIPGICADAERLGVRREHLYLVLKGKRKSKSLTTRYHQLQKQKEKTHAESD